MKLIPLSLVLIAVLTIKTTRSSEAFSENEDDDDLYDLLAQESNLDEQFYASSQYVLPNSVFNDGKPFFVERDPSTGAIDFEHKKPAGSQNLIADEIKNNDGKDAYSSDVKDVVLEQSSPNFHDFLNLPVKYTNTKFVYPLISSSYANLKYQGNNKSFVSNHKNYTTSTTTSPKYYTKTSTTETTKTDTTKTIAQSTSPKRTTTVHTTTPRRTTTTTTTTLAPSTTPEPITTTPPPTTKSLFTRYPYKSTIKNKYLDTADTRKKYFLSSTTLSLPSTTTKPPTTLSLTTTTLGTSATSSSSSAAPSTSSTSETTIIHTTKLAQKTRGPPKHPIKFVDDERPTTPAGTTKFHMPTVKYESPIGQPSPFKANPFKPLPPTQAQLQLKFKNESESSGNKEPSVMSLSEIFNSLSSKDQSNEVPYETTTVDNTSPSSNYQIPEQEQQPNQYHNQYVKYDVQEPNFKPPQVYNQVPSMNNIRISPDQHSASFVLGSQQAVGSSGQFLGSASPDSASSAALSQTYQMGTVFDEAKQPKDIIKTSSVRFPSESDNEKFENAPIVTGTFKSEVLSPNGHSAPIGLQQNQVVVFPPNDNLDNSLHEVTNRIVFDTPNSDTLNQNEVTHEVTLNGQINYQQTHGQINYQQTPSEELTPPSSNQMMLQTRPPPPPPSPTQIQNTPFIYKELSRRPYPSDRPRPPPLGLLPNILPQFRPNAKISHGHPYNKEAGTVRVTQQQQSYPPSRKPFRDNAQPIRRTLPTRFMSRINTAAPIPSPPMENMENRRYYRVPPPLPQLKDRVYNIRPPRLPHPARFVDGFPSIEKHALHENFDVKSDNIEDNEFHRNPPTAEMLKAEKPEAPKLEPVVTLQMLQSKKQMAEKQKLSSEAAQTADLTANGEIGEPKPANNTPVYVVYPVKTAPVKLDIMSPTDTEEPIVVGLRGEQSPLPPSKISPGSEYQNTPFSVVSHFEQEPILMAKDKSKHHNKDKFPYHLEKPAPGLDYKDLRKEPKLKKGEFLENPRETIYNIGEEPMGQIVQHELYNMVNKFGKGTDRPIAIAYTPTEPNHQYPFNRPNNNYYYQSYDDEKFSMPNYGGPVIKEQQVPETQTEISYLRDELDELGYPLRGEHYQQNFQAPFHASMSIDGNNKVTNPYEGWAVVTSDPKAESNKIDRSDDNVDHNDEKIVVKSEEGIEVTTKRFDLNSFQPEYLSGFQPIYSDDAKSTAHLHPNLKAALENLKIEEVERPISTQLHVVPLPETKQQDELDTKTMGNMEMDSLERFFDEIARDYDDNQNLDDVSLDENSTSHTEDSSSNSSSN